MCYHVLNRGNGRAEVFHKDDDYAAFLKLLRQASERANQRGANQRGHGKRRDKPAWSWE